jgi:hypothetical protein
MSSRAKWLLGAAVLIAVLVPTLAVAAGEGNPLRGGVRNPSPNETRALTSETEVIANTSTYGTRQSNKSDNGGGAIYGCRSGAGGSTAGNEPCVRAVNLSSGRAFEFEASATEAGRIDVGGGGDTVRPFSTNATGVATGLNADEVDGYDGAQLAPRFAAVTATGALGPNRGAAAATRDDVGTYRVTFAADVVNCAFSATVVGGPGELGFATVEQVDARNVRVRTAQRAGDNAIADRAFHLVTYC